MWADSLEKKQKYVFYWQIMKSDKNKKPSFLQVFLSAVVIWMLSLCLVLSYWAPQASQQLADLLLHCLPVLDYTHTEAYLPVSPHLRWAPPFVFKCACACVFE